MMISAKYKHFLYFPLRLIDYRSPEVRENLSYSCRLIKIQEVLFLPFSGQTQLQLWPAPPVLPGLVTALRETRPSSPVCSLRPFWSTSWGFRRLHRGCLVAVGGWDDFRNHLGTSKGSETSWNQLKTADFSLLNVGLLSKVSSALRIQLGGAEWVLKVRAIIREAVGVEIFTLTSNLSELERF